MKGVTPGLRATIGPGADIRQLVHPQISLMTKTDLGQLGHPYAVSPRRRTAFSERDLLKRVRSHSILHRTHRKKRVVCATQSRRPSPLRCLDFQINSNTMYYPEALH